MKRYIFLFLSIALLLFADSYCESFLKEENTCAYSSSEVKEYSSLIRSKITSESKYQYLLNSRDGDCGNIVSRFIILPTGKLADSSIEFMEDSVDNAALKKITLLALKKISLPPFPSFLQGKCPRGILFKIAIKYVDDGKLTAKYFKRGNIGIVFRAIDKDLIEIYDLDIKNGLMVLHILKNSPAELSGLKVGDIISQIDGKDVNDAKIARKLIASNYGALTINTNRGYFTIKRRIGEKYQK